VLGVGIVPDIRKCVTTDLKEEGDPIYLVGETQQEMAGSALFRKFHGRGGEVPGVMPTALSQSILALSECFDRQLVRSCHDVSDGGLGVALAEMCIGGDLGINADILSMGKLPSAVKLFSESHSRWVVEVPRDKENEWLQRMRAPATKIGVVGGKMLVIEDKDVLVDVEVKELRRAWSEPMWKVMG
jgi:phosphoribosylformylglycinamidine synthase